MQKLIEKVLNLIRRMMILTRREELGLGNFLQRQFSTVTSFARFTSFLSFRHKNEEYQLVHVLLLLYYHYYCMLSSIVVTIIVLTPQEEGAFNLQLRPICSVTNDTPVFKKLRLSIFRKKQMIKK